MLNLKNSFGDLQIEYECDLVLDFEILGLSDEEKTLIEEINGEAIRLAELEKDKAERDRKDSKPKSQQQKRKKIKGS